MTGEGYCDEVKFAKNEENIFEGTDDDGYSIVQIAEHALKYRRGNVPLVNDNTQDATAYNARCRTGDWLTNIKERGIKMSNLIVMRDSDEAAHYCTNIKGWVSRKGLFYGDKQGAEDIARYAGCTHVKCEKCGEPTEKRYTQCEECRLKNKISHYKSLPSAEWDGKTMLYSELNDKYYDSLECAEEDLDNDQTLNDLLLVICEPNYVPELDSDYCSYILDDDEDLPVEVEKAMKIFNESVKNITISWSPGKVRLKLMGGNNYE